MTRAIEKLLDKFIKESNHHHGVVAMKNVYLDAVRRGMASRLRVDALIDQQITVTIDLDGLVQIWGVGVGGIYIEAAYRRRRDETQAWWFSMLQKVEKDTLLHPHNVGVLCTGVSLSGIATTKPSALIPAAIGAASTASYPESVQFALELETLGIDPLPKQAKELIDVWAR